MPSINLSIVVLLVLVFFSGHGATVQYGEVETCAGQNEDFVLSITDCV